MCVCVCVCVKNVSKLVLYAQSTGAVYQGELKMWRGTKVEAGAGI